MKIGDFVKGIDQDRYSVTNTNMTRGLVTAIDGDFIKIKIIEHTNGATGNYIVESKYFEVIGHVNEFNRAEVFELLKNGCKKAILDYDLREADLRGADLRGADLCGANLCEADLCGADLDFSCLPLKCGGLKWKIDKRLACQLAYHLCSMQCDDVEFIKMRNSILGFANQFHRVEECGKLEEVKI